MPELSDQSDGQLAGPGSMLSSPICEVEGGSLLGLGDGKKIVVSAILRIARQAPAWCRCMHASSICMPASAPLQVIKVGSSSLVKVWPDQQTLNLSALARICDVVKALKSTGD